LFTFSFFAFAQFCHVTHVLLEDKGGTTGHHWVLKAL
jgi:hypothetical protein